MAIEVFNRYEHKHLLNTAEFGAIRKTVEQHMAPTRTISAASRTPLPTYIMIRQTIILSETVSASRCTKKSSGSELTAFPR